MVNIIKEELPIEESLKRKLELICEFSKTTPTIIISSLKNTIEYWKDKFDKVISFLHSKLHNWYDKDDKYIDVVNDMYEDNVLDDNIKDLKLNKKKR